MKRKRTGGTLFITADAEAAIPKDEISTALDDHLKSDRRRSSYTSERGVKFLIVTKLGQTTVLLPGAKF